MEKGSIFVAFRKVKRDRIKLKKKNIIIRIFKLNDSFAKSRLEEFQIISLPIWFFLKEFEFSWKVFTYKCNSTFINI